MNLIEFGFRLRQRGKTVRPTVVGRGIYFDSSGNWFISGENWFYMIGGQRLDYSSTAWQPLGMYCAQEFEILVTDWFWIDYSKLERRKKRWFHFLVDSFDDEGLGQSVEVNPADRWDAEESDLDSVVPDIEIPELPENEEDNSTESTK